ncbi:coiled-coil domain-containing protein 169 isoform X2 [Agelaius phoeniceus]|uniref:coiled-coil domain-containing protein 169 isoform X2 n=1 Tax=Agelaius phoeniceus TaxID=39638 RepID=UPI004054FCC7
MLGISLDRGQSSPSNAGLHRSGGRALLQTRRTGQGGGRPSGPGQVPAVAPDPVAPLGFLWAAGEPRGVRSKRQMLESSIFELRNTVTELEKSLNSTENEDNEWKTRYETQVEWNKQLERQINVLRDKVELIRGNPADKLSLVRTFDKMPVGSLKEVLKQLEEEKKILQNQLKDYELRLEQEAKTSAKPKIFERKKTDALTGKGEKQILRVEQLQQKGHTMFSSLPCPPGPQAVYLTSRRGLKSLLHKGKQTISFISRRISSLKFLH